jgi:hypothetical protein
LKRTWCVRSLVSACLLSALVAFYIATGVRGASFGGMWDEGYHTEGVSHAVETVGFMPDGYYYGGLYYLPGYLLVGRPFLTRLPQVLQEVSDAPSRPFDPSQYPAIVAAQNAAKTILARDDYYERARHVFVVFSAFAIVWAFLAAQSASGSFASGLVAASVVGLSWEFSYHGRFIATDAMLAQFTALTLALLMRALVAVTRSRERAWLRLAAVAAGLGIGAKVPGVFLFVPVLVAVLCSVHTRGVRARLSCVLELGLFTALAFVVTTPGAVLDPLHFAGDLLRASSDYNRISDDYTYAEANAWKRLAIIVEYLSVVLPSPYPALSLILCAFAATGALVGLRERRGSVLCIVAFLAAYVGFVSQQRLVIVRNLMAVLPPIAILAALGLNWTFERAGAFPRARLGLALSLLLALPLQATWLWQSATSARDADRVVVAEEVLEALREHPTRPTYIAPDVLKALDQVRPESEPRLRSARKVAAEQAVVFASALPSYKANQRGRARYFARRFANYDYYPGLLTGFGRKPTDAPMLIVPRPSAVELGLLD